MKLYITHMYKADPENYQMVSRRKKWILMIVSIFVCRIYI